MKDHQSNVQKTHRAQVTASLSLQPSSTPSLSVFSAETVNDPSQKPNQEIPPGGNIRKISGENLGMSGQMVKQNTEINSTGASHHSLEETLEKLPGKGGSTRNFRENPEIPGEKSPQPEVRCDPEVLLQEVRCQNLAHVNG